MKVHSSEVSPTYMGIRNKLSALFSGPLLALAVFAILLSVSAFASGADASNKRLVSIFADGQKQTIVTAQTTVNEVLASAEVSLHDKDLVEPARDTVIDGDVYKINVYRARPYTLIDGKKEIDVLSAYQSPRLIAETSGIKVFPEDRFSVERIDNIVDENMLGQRIKINRATPVNLHVYGEKVVHRTHKKTVKGVLEEKGITLAEGDIVAPTASARVTGGMNVHVLSVGASNSVVEEEIPFPSDKTYDSSLDAGQTIVKTPGKNGKRVVTYDIVLHNGVEVSRTEVSSITIEEPVAEVVVIGTKSADPSGNAAIGQAMAAQRGWTGNEWGCLYQLWLHESGWNHLTSNYGGSGAYGIPQALPGSKMSSAGADWATNPRTQIAWGLGYVGGRYGTPCGAMSHFDSVGWY